MDVMDLRRRLMMMPQKGGILDKILEVVDTFTPTESGIYEHAFSYDGLNGVYFIITDPPGNIENMLAESDLPAAGLLSYVHICITGASHDVRGQYTTTYRSNATGYVDYWAPSITASSDAIAVNLAGGTRIAYRVGYTYYFCRVKQ